MKFFAYYFFRFAFLFLYCTVKRYKKSKSKTAVSFFQLSLFMRSMARGRCIARTRVIYKCSSYRVIWFANRQPSETWAAVSPECMYLSLLLAISPIYTGRYSVRTFTCGRRPPSLWSHLLSDVLCKWPF